MNIKINSVHFSADSRLESLVRTKIEKLAQHHEDILSAEVFLRLENTQDSDNKIVEIRLEIPGAPIFAKKQCETFEKAVDETVDAIKSQLTKIKGKRTK